MGKFNLDFPQKCLIFSDFENFQENIFLDFYDHEKNIFSSRKFFFGFFHKWLYFISKLSNFHHQTQKMRGRGATWFQKPSKILDFAPKLTFIALAFIWANSYIWTSKLKTWYIWWFWRIFGGKPCPILDQNELGDENLGAWI